MRVLTLALLILSLSFARGAHAQRARPLGFVPHAAAPVNVHFRSSLAALPGNPGTPRWVRWGLVGAIGGAVLFVLADGFNSGARSTGSNVLAGAVTGFVVVGGGVLLYDSICSGGSGHSGFCGR